MAGFTNLGQFSNNTNPSTTCSGTSVNATSAGDKVVLALFVPNSNPTALTVTFDGQAMTEIVGARAVRGNFTSMVFYYDDVAGRLTGKTISASWTNSGTSAGGGSLISAGTITPTNAFLTGASDVQNPNNGQNTSPTTAASGAVSDSTANYFALAVLGINFNTTGEETAANSYTSLPQSSNVTRSLLLDVAAKEFTAPVSSTTETWTVTWAGSEPWVSSILMFRESVPGAPTNSAAPVVSGTATVGNALSTTNGTWTGSPTSFTYDWQRDVGSGGVTWVSIDTSQSVTLTNGSPTVTVVDITKFRVGDPIHGTNIPTGATVSEITNATTIVMSQNATGSGATTAYFGANNLNSYTVTANDLGCEIRCRVTAINGSGSSSPTPSNATSVVPASSNPTYRVVLYPLAQSDNTSHSSTLALPVLAGETLVFLGGCSVNNVGGNVGSITDSAGDTWVLRQDASVIDSTHGHGCQAFSTVCASGMAFGSTVTSHIKATTVVGSNALNSAIVNVVSTAGFDPAGSVNINGIAVTYTGLTSTSLTGCGNHAAYVGGEAVNYHGQSPYWMVVAINPGSGSTCSYDTGSAAAQNNVTSLTSGTVNTAGPTSVALGFQTRTGIDVFTPAAGWTKIQDGPAANAGNPYTGESGYCGSAVAQILSSPQTGFAASGTIPDFQDAGSVLVVFTVTAAANAVKSTLTPTGASINADGLSTLALTVQAKDANGNNETTGGATVTITQQSGTGSIGPVTDNGNGTYTAMVTAPAVAGSGVFVATLGGNPVESGGASQTQATITYTSATSKSPYTQRTRDRITRPIRWRIG